jgi:hypothetical protein
MLYFEPIGSTAKLASQPDLFDSILGIVKPVARLKASDIEVSSKDVHVRLEYDGKIISAESAGAYLARFQHYLEFPSHLVL